MSAFSIGFNKIPPTILVLAAVLLWSSGGLFIKLTTLDAFAVNFGRSFLAAIVIGVFIGRDVFRVNELTFVSALFYALTLISFVFASKLTTAANAIFLQYTAPIYILIFAPFLLKEKFRIADLVTVTVCLCGMSLFFVGQFENKGLAGNFAGLVSGVGLGLYFLFLRHPQMLKLNPAVSVFYGNLLISVLMLPFLLFNIPNVSATDLFAVGFLGIFQIGVAYLLFTYGVARGVKSLDASIIGFIEPLLNPVWVFLIVGEKPSNWAILGGLMILAAVAFHTLFDAEKTKPKQIE